MKPRLFAALVVFGLAAMPLAGPRADGAAAPSANPSANPSTRPSIGPSVVELFTSQSCYSCPPAEAYLGRLAGRADIIALEFHVDYWNDLVYGTAGRWRDVHSDPAYTKRQRAYGERLAGGVYTPQMVIDGRAQAIGSRERDVEAAIRAARRSPRLTVQLVTRDAGKTEIRVSGGAGLSEQAAEVWLVRFKLREETKIRSGENRGKTLVNHHIVTGMTKLGAIVLDAETTILDAVLPVLDDGCAVLVQAGDGSGGLGPVLGAARCPDPPAGKAM